MKTAVIIQGEGKGHFSQAMEAIEMVRARGGEVTGCYLGRSLFKTTPGYFRETCPVAIKSFLSPNFMRTPDRKGIRIVLSLMLNAILAPVYLFETLRLGIMLRYDGSSQLLNFYDPVGAVAGKWMKRRARRTIVSHHFYLSHPDFIHPHGMERSYFWLQLMNHIMIRKADEIMALSFRKGSRQGKITVVPPLVTGKLQGTEGNQRGSESQRESETQMGSESQIGSEGQKEAGHQIFAKQQGKNNLKSKDERHRTVKLQGTEALQSTAKHRTVSDPGTDRPQESQEKGPDLCYFLETGFVEEMLRYYRDRAHLSADLFMQDPGRFLPPENVRLHEADREQFLSAMQHAGRVICTAGFDTVAEAFYLGVPVFVIPSENHYEQYCNALDAARTGMAFQLESLEDFDDAVFEPASNQSFLKWLETGHEALFHYLSRYY